MGHRRETLTNSQGLLSGGSVAGYVLKLARMSAGLTQDRLAETLVVDVSTVQGWESGRRALSSISTADFVWLGARLVRLGAPPSTTEHLREAVEADLVLSTGIASAHRWSDSDYHPLSAHVHRRNLTNLITWPLTGVLPSQLSLFTANTRPRGPVAACPTLPVEKAERFFDHLMTVAECQPQSHHSLLRRQAVYLLAFDTRPQVAEWLQGEWRRATRQRPPEGDIHRLMAARSASVALAFAGDQTHLRDFVSTAAGTTAEIANLNYWAYWLGEIADEQANDRFVTDHTANQWSGTRLLRHLIARLDPVSSQLPLNLHTVHALVASRPELLAGQSTMRATLRDALDRIASHETATRRERDQVAGLHYALRIADR